jgi:hypothetical protein
MKFLILTMVSFSWGFELVLVFILEQILHLRLALAMKID